MVFINTLNPQTFVLVEMANEFIEILKMYDTK